MEGRMDGTVDMLEAMYKKADADLDLLSHKLDAEFSNAAGGDGENQNKPNPTELLKSIAEVKQEYAAIVKEAEAIKQAQQEAMDFFRGELMTLCDTLGKLQYNVEGKEKPEELSQVQKVLGVEVSPALGQPELGACGGSAISSTEEARSQPASDVPLPETPVASTQPSGATKEPVLSPHEKRVQSPEFIELSKEEFLSVSSLVRGRVKLAEVNQTYRVLWHHFKEEGNTDALGSQDMFKMGLRVTGQTGEAKLKVLRTLKLLDISRKGEVTLT